MGTAEWIAVALFLVAGAYYAYNGRLRRQRTRRERHAEAVRIRTESRSLVAAASIDNSGGHGDDGSLLLRCAECGMPFERGEVACSVCLAWLTDRRTLDDGPLGHFARQRRARLVRVATSVVYAGCWLGALFLQGQAVSGDSPRTFRDLAAAAPTLILLGGFALYGLPGRTLHHYPVRALVRRGRPAWWKGAAASAAFVVLVVVATELITRPVLAGRYSAFRSSPEISETVASCYQIGFGTVAIVLLWNLIVHAVARPQGMDDDRRMQAVRLHGSPA